MGNCSMNARELDDSVLWNAIYYDLSFLKHDHQRSHLVYIRKSLMLVSAVQTGDRVTIV